MLRGAPTCCCRIRVWMRFISKDWTLMPIDFVRPCVEPNLFLRIKGGRFIVRCPNACREFTKLLDLSINYDHVVGYSDLYRLGSSYWSKSLVGLDSLGLFRDRNQRTSLLFFFSSHWFIINRFTCSYLVALIKKVLCAYQVVAAVRISHYNKSSLNSAQPSHRLLLSNCKFVPGVKKSTFVEI